MKKRETQKKWTGGIKWSLALYDALALLAVTLLLYLLHPGMDVGAPLRETLACGGVMLIFVVGLRILFHSYNQIWRYAKTPCYIRLILCDGLACVPTYAVQRMLLTPSFPFLWVACAVCMNLLAGLLMRLLYQYLYQSAVERTSRFPFGAKLIALLTGLNMEQEQKQHRSQQRRIDIAIVGAGRIGVMLAEELLENEKASYTPRCFIDVDQGKVGRMIHGVKVLSENEVTLEMLTELGVQEIVFAIPGAPAEKKKLLYETYQATGCRLKTYDFPVPQSVGSGSPKGKRRLRSFEPQELLFREVKDFTTPETRAYYTGKTVLITGGGGSIGSELCRQIAKMQPRQLVILDVYENCAYDIQQELKIAYGEELDLAVEILSVTDYDQLETVFAQYRPNVVLHAAAHKHVPLMEHNCCERSRTMCSAHTMWWNCLSATAWTSSS